MFREIQRQCRLAKENHYNQICNELEDLDRKHNPKLFNRIRNLQPKKPYSRVGLQYKEDKMLLATQEVLDRWAEYVGELYAANKQILRMTNVDNQGIERITEEQVMGVFGKVLRN